MDVVPLPQRRRGRNGKKRAETHEVENVGKVVGKAAVEGKSTQVAERRVAQSVRDSASSRGVSTSGQMGARNGNRKGRDRVVPQQVYKAAQNFQNRFQTYDDQTGALESSSLANPYGRGGLGVRRSLGVTRRMNASTKYMMAVMDPEQWGMNMRLPDDYAGKTAAWMAKTQVNVPLFANSYNYGNNSSFPQGGFLIWASPAFETPLRYMHEFTNPVNDSWTIMAVAENQEHGFFALTGSGDTDSQFDGSQRLELNNGNAMIVNLVGNLTMGNYMPPNIAPPFLNVTSDSSVFYGFSINFNAGTTTFVAQTNCITTSGLVGAINLTIVDVTSPTAQVIPLTIAADGSINVSFTPTTNMGACLGDAMIGFRLSMNPASPFPQQVVVFSNWSINVDMTASFNQFSWMGIQFVGYPEAAPNYSRFRVNAMSMLTSFLGSTLSDGGQIAARLTEGGVPALWDGDESTQNLNWIMTGLGESPGAFGPDPVKKGAYTYWLPKDESDLEFKFRRIDGFLSRQIVHSGVVPRQGGVGFTVSSIIRLRLVICYECLTATQWIPVADTPSNPNVVLELKKLIDRKDVPTSMPNDLHKDIVSWSTLPLDILNQNIPLLESVIKGAAPLIKLLGFAF